MAGGNTGLLTARCDPYGAESRIRLLGGVYDESHTGRIKWHCQNRAAARYRMVCTGGGYGERVAPDGGLVAATVCPGGHQGQEMALCDDHRREIQRRQAGACPACLYPPRARGVLAELEAVQAQISTLGFFRLPELARLTSISDQLMAAGDELISRGIVHKCPLTLVEVS
jgi:hypothetical protein